MRRFYRFANSKLKNKHGVGPLLREDGTLAVEDKEKAQILNDFFASVFTVDNGNMPDFPDRSDGSNIENVVFTQAKVHDSLKSLPNKLSRTPDGLPALLLKKLAFGLSEPLCSLFNVSFNSGELPKIWLTAEVTAVYKKGLASNASNYRPVSLTCIACKVMESIIKDKLISHLVANDLLTEHQHGFLPKKSVSTQLLECFNYYSEAFMQKQPVDVIFLYYCKAFDSISHQKLLVKLEGYGIRGRLLTWIRSFLSGRSQRVCVNGSFSDYACVTSGVPQGSVLGPLAFLLYVNDVTDVIKNAKIKLFADDIKLYFALPQGINSGAQLAEDLQTVYLWSAEWQLKLAIEKCVVLHLGHKNPKYDYYIRDDTKLQVAQEYRDLGVLVSSSEKFGYSVSSHCKLISSKAMKIVGLIFKIFSTKSPALLLKAYKTYVRPILESSAVAWSPFLLKDIECIERVQRVFTRKLFFRCHWDYASYEERCKLLKINSLELRRSKFDLIMCYNIMKNRVGIRRDDFFTLSSYKKTKGHEMKLFRPHVRVEVRKHFFSSRVIQLWNDLDERMALLPTLSMFKQYLSVTDAASGCKVYAF